MIIDFKDCDEYYIASMTTNELPNLMDYITIKTMCKRISGKVISIEKEYNTFRNTIRNIVKIDYRIPK